MWSVVVLRPLETSSCIMRVLHVVFLLSNSIGCTAALATTGTRVLRPTSMLRARSLSMPAADDGSICITEAGLSDVEPVLDLTMLVFFGELGSDRGFNNNLAKAFDELRGEQDESLRGILSDPSSVSLKVSLDEMLVGFVTVSGSGVLTNLAVHPNVRRRRVGWRLMKRLLETVRASTMTDNVHLEVDGDNQPAYELYKACGFAVLEDDKSGTRYKVDRWRGRTLEEVFKIVMRYDLRAES